MLFPLRAAVFPGRYVLRVVNKDMTYATQLKDYEDAVISKRFEELQEDEVRRRGRRASCPSRRPPSLLSIPERRASRAFRALRSGGWRERAIAPRTRGFLSARLHVSAPQVAALLQEIEREESAQP